MYKRRRTYTNAFTLVEFIAVTLILGVLASLGVTNYGIVLERMRAKEGVNYLIGILGAQKRWAADKGTYATQSEFNAGNLDWQMPGSSTKFNAPTFPGSARLTGVHFDDILVDIPRNNVAPFNYILHITASKGTISCTGGGAGICTKLGF